MQPVTVLSSESVLQFEECIDRGLVKWIMGDAGGALRMYRKAVTVNPDGALGHYLHGFILDEMGRREEARLQYARVLKTLDPSPQGNWARRQATRLIES